MTNLNFRYLADSKSALSLSHLGSDSNLKADDRAYLYLNAMCYGPLSRHLSLRGSLSCHCPVTLMASPGFRPSNIPSPGARRSDIIGGDAVRAKRAPVG